MNNTLKVRPATHHDLETLLEFEQGVIEAERPFDITLKRGATRYYDLEEMITAPHIELVVAELDGQLVGSGYARIENAKPYLQHVQHGYLGFMYVKPEHRGKGINQKIIERLKTWCVEQGILELRLEVYFLNEPAIKAYEKIGFEKHMFEMRLGIRQPKIFS
jgi:ribosomal protein S18 acetylase RimI-like enzyme